MWQRREARVRAGIFRSLTFPSISTRIKRLRRLIDHAQPLGFCRIARCTVRRIHFFEGHSARLSASPQLHHRPPSSSPLPFSNRVPSQRPDRYRRESAIFETTTPLAANPRSVTRVLRNRNSPRSNSKTSQSPCLIHRAAVKSKSTRITASGDSSTRKEKFCRRLSQ